MKPIFKIITRTTLLCLVFLFSGCNSYKYISQNGKIDNRFVGKWKGEEIIHESNTKRTWIQNRKINGTYRIDFIYEIDGIITKYTEKGYWWTIDDKFYEINPKVMDVPDEYKYEIIDSDQIKFTAIHVDISSDKYLKEYSFYDKRINSR